jgi:hypothetical protein
MFFAPPGIRVRAFCILALVVSRGAIHHGGGRFHWITPPRCRRADCTPDIATCTFAEKQNDPREAGPQNLFEKIPDRRC